ncbi:hypothetical protein JCM24511_01603 [Saitozyma sp. JCM 24511]|nr:hypothetical protein JCM24511_01603 [Saitozyma sp. JCM 24511]
MSASTADDPHSRSPGTSASPPPPRAPPPNPDPSGSSKSASKASATPSTSALPPPDQAQIDSHLSAVRRRSVAHVAHVPRVLGRPEAGVVLGGVEPQEGDEQDMRTYGEEADELLRSATVEMEAFVNAVGEAITMVRGDQEVRFDERGQETGLEEEENRQEYVWDVLFENQRGIYFLGKAYFSSQTLLPADPTPYTLPSQAIPSASSITVVQPATSNSSDPSPAQTGTSDAPASSRLAKSAASASVGDEKTRGSRPIDTAYTPETFQPPTPDWEWVTPWMANMRLGTDEAGWKYNAWFRRRGWRSHAGPAGWWGWVRRREWVRLRRMKQKEEVLQIDEAAKVERLGREEEFESGEDDGPDRLDKALQESEEGGDVGESVRAVLGVMGTMPLDRRKMEVWQAWLGKVDDKSKGKLQEVLDEPRAVEELRRGMTYHPTYIALLELFRSHGLSIASTSSISAEHPGDFLPSPERPTKPDPTSRDSGYAV